jgi:phospholipase C
VAEGEVFNDEHRHTSLIATLREEWDLGAPFTDRDATARSFSHVFTLDSPRDPQTWPVPEARPVPKFTEDASALGQAVSVLGKTLLDGLRGYAERQNIKLEGLPEDPKADIPPEQILTVLRSALAMFFPLLAPASAK